MKKNTNSQRRGSSARASAFLAFAAALLGVLAISRDAAAQDVQSDAQADTTDGGDSGASTSTVTVTATGASASASGQASGGRVQQVVDQVAHREGVTVGGHCVDGEADCIEIVDERITYACRQDTSDCSDDATCPNRALVIAERAQAQLRRFRREVRRELIAIHHDLDEQRARNDVQDAIDQRFFGWSSDTPPRERLHIARETGRYVREIVPMLFMENEIRDDEDRAEFEAAQRARADFERLTNQKLGDLQTQITNEVHAREALGRRVDGIEQRLSRHTLGFAAVGEAELLGGHGMLGATVRVMWRTGGFAASAQGGGFWNSTLDAGTFVAGADAGAALDVGDAMRIDLGGYVRTMQLPEDQLGERSGRIVRSAGNLFFEGGAFGRWFSNRRGASLLVEARIGIADPPGDGNVGVVAAVGIGAAANLGL